MTSKTDKFAALGQQTSFTPRDAISAFHNDTEADRIGRRTLTNFAALDLDRIITKDQVRKTYSEEKHQEMVAMLRESGQLQPIVVYWSEEDQRYVVFMGHRRFRAAPEAGLDKIDCCILSEPPSEEELTEKQLVENIAREDLNPMDEAEAFDKLCQQKGMDGQQLAEYLGKAASTIQRSIKLLELPETVADLIRDGRLSKTDGRELLKIGDDDAICKMADKLLDGMTTSELKEAVKKKPGARSVGKTKPRANSKATKFTAGGIDFVATSKKKPTKAELIVAMQDAIDKFREDGRVSKAA